MSKQKKDIPAWQREFLSTGEGTFDFDLQLPSLPVPPLHNTLRVYLDSVKPHLTDEEFRHTEKLVGNFEKGEGQYLQSKLIQKADHEQNWLTKWFEESMYLHLRIPMSPFINTAGPSVVPEHLWPLGSHVGFKYLGSYLYWLLNFMALAREEKLKPFRLQTGERLSMDQYRRFFSTVRIPGEEVDRIETYWKTEREGPIPTHIVVLCRGYVFTVDTVNRQGAPLAASELEQVIQKVSDICKSRPYGPSVGALTCDNRTSWAKNREYLITLNPINKQSLRMIEESLFVVGLDDTAVPDASAAVKEALLGNIRNRFADKSCTIIYFPDGRVSNTADHAPFDGLIATTIIHYCYLRIMDEIASGNLSWDSLVNREMLPEPIELKFVVDDKITRSVETCVQSAKMVAQTFDVLVRPFEKYGKRFIRQHGVHPDSYMQLAGQLAYYRLHGRPAPTYETATTRQFYVGRTETVRTCTNEALDWVKAMSDTNVEVQKCRKLFVRAALKHVQLMLEGKDNHGCDRHLLGLEMIAYEQGLPRPQIFEDVAWKKSGGDGNFLLSSSLIGYTENIGGTLPMCENGYGYFYSILNDKVKFYLTEFKGSPETDVYKFYSSLDQTMCDMRDMLAASIPKL